MLSGTGYRAQCVVYHLLRFFSNLLGLLLNQLATQYTQLWLDEPHRLFGEVHAFSKLDNSD